MKRTSWWLGGAVLVAVGWACSGEITDTIYFNDPAVDFGSPPSPLTVDYWGEYTTREPVQRAGYSDRDYERRYKMEEDADALAKEAVVAIKARQLAKLIRVTDDELTLRAQLPDPTGIDALRDRKLVLAVPAGAGLWEYLAARSAVKSNDALALLAKVPAGPYSAFVTYYRGELKDSAAEFERVAKSTGPLKGRATIMAARQLVADAYPAGKPNAGSAAATTRARGYINTILRTPDFARFQWSARGLLARIDFAEQRFGKAAVQYLDLIHTSKTPAEELSATSSLRLSLARLTPADGVFIHDEILRRPALFEPYAEYRIYHSWSEGNDGVSKRTGDLAGVARFGREVLAKNPGAPIAGAVKARLAEIAYQSGDFVTAQTLADSALKDATAERRDLARYVAAGARYRQKSYRSALDVLNSGAADFANSYLSAPANELKAVCHQSVGDFAGALDAYRTLKYQRDVAYLVDVRMSIDQLRAYIDQRPNDPDRDKWTASLGYRLLRKGDFAAAKTEFSKLDDARRRALVKAGSTDYRWEEVPGVDVIPDPLVTVRELQDLRAKATDAEGLYALASYYYNHRNLLLYNAAAWDGSRQVLVQLNSGVSTRDDRLAVREHTYEHEAIYRARAICLEIVKRYPESPVSSKALYRAATASRRLADFNKWWRLYGNTATLYDSAIALMERCATEYPNEPLAARARKYAKAFADEKAGNLLNAAFQKSDSAITGSE